MPIVANATEETIQIRLCGNYFTFKPGSQKTMNEDMARFISTERKNAGLAVLPDKPEHSDDGDDVTEESLKARQEEWETAKKATLEAARVAYISHLRQVIHNNQVSLRQDMERMNIKADPAAYVSEGELEAMRIVAKYDKKGQDADQARIAEVKKLMEQVKK